MPQTNFRRLTLATAATTYMLVVLGGAARAFGAAFPGGLTQQLLGYGYRAAGLAVLALSLGIALRGTNQRLGGWGLALLGGLAALGGPGADAVQPGVAMAFLSTWVLARSYTQQEEPFRSRLSMFRSQWQVPLYAALAASVVTLLGGYLKSIGSEAACHSWPLCTEFFAGGWSGVLYAHLAHRTAAALSGIFLIYTVVYVWRRHLHRPVLLTLAGVAIVLFTTQVVVGADAVRTGLSTLGSVAHLATAAALIGTLVALATVGYYSPTVPAITGADVAVALPAPRTFRQVLRDYLDTTKPRILVLLLITGYAAMWVGAKGFPDPVLTLITLLGLGMSCGAANAINMWYDQDIDSVMARTKKRPIPSGRLSPDQVLGFGILTGALSFVLLAFAVNLMTALLSLAGLLFYVCIYTMWLKRSTTQNIVIGGAAGAMPPLVGWAAVTGEVSWASVVMFLIVFVWTPPHFWALALFRNDDYRRANVPMLPVIKGEMRTKWEILIYSVLLFPTTMALYWTGAVGRIYLWVCVAACAVYLGANIALFRERLPVYKWAKRAFFWSIFWLGFVFLAMVIDIHK